MITIKAASGNFFSTGTVQRQADRMNRRNLNRIGAYCRTVAKNSMSTKKRSSPPGTPPAAHNKNIKNFLRFAVEGSHNVVIGPILLGGVKRNAYLNTLQLMEYGGPSVIYRKKLNRSVPKFYLPRPFMRPAFNVALDRIPRTYRNSFGGI